MLGKIILSGALIAALVGATSCIVSDRKIQAEKSAKQERIRISENEMLAAIRRLKESSRASTGWIADLGFNDPLSIKKIFTKDIEHPFITGKTTLAFGNISDVSNQTNDIHKITISLNSLAIQFGIFPDKHILFEVSCPKPYFYAIERLKKSIYGVDSLSEVTTVAVFSDFSAISDRQIGDGNGGAKREVLMVGSCVGLLLAPQDSEILRKEYFSKG